MKMFKRTLTMLLALCMLLSVVPMTAFATETDNTESVAAETEAVSKKTAEVLAQLEEGVVSSEALTLSAVDPEEFIRAFALDCGRLYFSVESIKEIIDVMAANDYTHLTLAFGNSGFRFLLDDMTIGSYSSNAVKNAIMAGNDSYVANDGHNGSTAPNTCLTQADMDAIITYANGKGIEIIPALNSPGHMNTIVYAMGQLGIQNAGYPVNSSYHSESTLNIDNASVMAFSDALIQKYINYFVGKGCKYFNLGADEFANDPTDDAKLGFNDSMKAGFISYVNRVASMITDAGMTPMMFNDGYAWSDADFNDDIVVCYWTGGAVSSTTIANAGHKVINNSQNYYYVLGEPFASSWCSYASATNGVNNVPVTRMVDGGNPGDKLIGSQMWLWCDYTDEEYTAEEETRVKTLISTLAENNPDYFDIPEAPAEPETRSVTVGIDGTTDTIENKAYTEAQIADPTKVSVELTVTEENVSSTAATALTDGATYILRIAGTNLALSKNQSQTRFSNALALQNNNLAANPDHLWQLEASGSGYKLKCADGYLTIGSESATINSTGEVFTFTQNGSGWQIVDADNYAFNNLGGEGALGGWTVNENPLTMELYAATPASTEVKFTGKASGNTTVTVGHVRYNITVVDFDVTETRNIFVQVGHSVTDTILNHAYYGVVVDDNTIASVDVNAESGSATMVSTSPATQLEDGATYILRIENTELALSKNQSTGGFSNGRALETNNLTVNQDHLWTLEASGNGYKLKNADGNYLSIGYESASVGSTGEVFTFTASGNGWVISDNENYAFNALGGISYRSLGGWTKNQSPLTMQLYKVNLATEGITEVTFNGLKVGTTTATVGHVLYNITVTAGETNLTYHPWISTYPIYPEGTGAANCSNGQGVPRDVSIPISTEGVYSEQGVEIASLVDPTGDWRWEEGAQTVYWKATVLPEGRHQTGVVNTDYAMKGSDFAYIRYWDGNWEYSADRLTWTAVKSTDEVCVYYLQETDVTQEIETFVKDWAFTPDNTDDAENGRYQKALSFAVVYPGGTMNPTEEDIYQQSTLIYYDNLANLGFVRFANNSTYEIEKITYTFGERVNHDADGNYKWTTEDAINWEKKTIDDHTWFDETVCWDPSYGTEPVVNGEDLVDVIYPGEGGYTDYKGSWGRDDAILLLVYLKPVVTEDSLTVVYYDEKFGEVLHTYPVNVDAGNNFNDHMGKVIIDSQGNVTLDTNEKAPAFTGNDKNRIDLTNGFGIENSNDVIQRFQTDLTKIPSIIGKYNSELYQYTGSEIKDDGKTLYLYYNFNEAALPVYVVDFGLPLSFNLNQITEEPVEAVSVVEQTKYGNLMCRTTKDTGAIFIYQPTSILQGADMLTISLTFTDGKSSTVNVRVIPATTVYYEEGFLFNENSTGWETTSNKGKVEQLPENLGHKVNNYGYDDVYADTAGASDDTNATTSTIGAKTEFTFTGKGIQIFANATEQSGYVAVEVMNSSDEVVNMSLVDTAATNGGTGATTGQNTNLYGLPIVSLVDLQNMPHDTYTVTMTKIMDSETVYIDGVRIFNTLADSGVYAPDLEDNPEFYELRDHVLSAIEITDYTSVDYGTLAEMAGQVYAGISSDEERPVAVITENKGADDIYGEGATAQDLLDNGPKNELYLREGQTLTFKVTTGRFMQLGLKAPNGAASVTMDVDGTAKTMNLKSSVDMFYTLAEPGDSKEHTVHITNNATDDGKDSILSVTLLKVCDDPSFAFAALTAEDVEDILVDVYGFEDDEEPVDPEDPVDPEKPENNKPGFHWPIFNWPGFNWPGFEWPGQDKPEDKPEVEPEIPSEPSQDQANAELKINLVDYTGKTVATAVLTENGTRGELCSFEAQQILDAAASKLPVKYQIVDDAAVADVEVTYGAVSEIVIQVGKVATLEVTYISIFGRKIGTATLTKVQTAGGRCVFTAKEIQQAAPKGHNAFFVMPATVSYGSNASVTVTVF